jgi:hypothetical protein
MAKYILTDEQVKNLHVIIDNTNIKGSSALAILQLKDALSKPVDEDAPIDMAQTKVG